jgi:hypothetical protein
LAWSTYGTKNGHVQQNQEANKRYAAENDDKTDACKVFSVVFIDWAYLVLQLLWFWTGRHGCGRVANEVQTRAATDDSEARSTIIVYACGDKLRIVT